MKKNKILVFLLILFIGAIPTTNAKAITASMSCSSQSSVTLGNTISVTIRGNASEAGYWEGMMSYDSSKLQLISGSARIFDESAGAFQEIYISGGRIGLTLKVPVEALLKVTGGKLADITVKEE